MPRAATAPSAIKTQLKTNKITRDPGDARAEKRQARKQSKVARLGVHSCFRLERGSNQAAPPCVRELMALSRKYDHVCPRRDGRPSFWERPGHAPPDREGTARSGR